MAEIDRTLKLLEQNYSLLSAKYYRKLMTHIQKCYQVLIKMSKMAIGRKQHILTKIGLFKRMPYLIKIMVRNHEWGVVKGMGLKNIVPKLNGWKLNQFAKHS